MKSLALACLGMVILAAPSVAQTAVAPIKPPASPTKPQASPTKPAASPTKAEAAKAAPVVVEEPRDIVGRIYTLAAASLTKGKTDGPFYDRKVREAYFSRGFDLLVTTAETKASHDGDAVLTFDPISASQDAELKKVTLTTDLLELDKAVVSASFANHGLPTVVSFDFIKEDGDWKINDIKGTTEKEAWSVRKILKASGKPPTELPGQPDAAAARPAATPPSQVRPSSSGSTGKASRGE